MKITHNKVGQNLNVSDAKAEKSGKAGAAKSAVDAKDITAGKAAVAKEAGAASRVNISDRGQDIKRAKEIAMNTPDVNEEKVARLQKLIDDGNYKTDAKEIAGKMLDEHMSWE